MEVDTGIFPISSWSAFEQKFFPVNTESDTTNVLEGSSYYQSNQMVEDYLDSFQALVSNASYRPRLELKSSKVYPLSPVEQKELDTFLEENLHTGCIWPSKSPMTTLVFFIKKKDSSIWLVQGYWALNSMMIKNKYPLPLIFKLISQLCRAKYFTKLNIHWGFNNVCIKPRDKWKAIFHTNWGLFKPLVMFFDMANNPATF